jgi:adenylate cyclase
MTSGGKVTGSSTRLRAALLVAAASATVALLLSLVPDLQVIESKSLDLRFRLRGAADRSGSGIEVVYVDEQSIAFYRDSFGRWPWPREVFGRMIDYIAAGKPKAIVFDIFFSEPDLKNPGSDEVLFGATASAGNVWHTAIGEQSGTPPSEGFLRHGRVVGGSPPGRVPAYPSVTAPLPRLLAGARGVGVINYHADPDGPSRWTWPVQRVVGKDFLSLPFAVAADLLGGEVRWTGDGALALGPRRVPLTPDGRFLINWRGPAYTYPRRSAGEVIESILLADEGKPPVVPAAEFAGKVVIIGASAVSVYDLRVNPFSQVLPGVDLNAAVMDNLLNGPFLRRAGAWWGAFLTVLVALGVALPATLLRKTWAKVCAAGSLIILWPVVVHGAFVAADLWLPVVFPAVAGVLALIGASVFSYATEGKERRRILAAFSRCVSHQVADAIAGDPRILRLGAGERRGVTVLFSDIRGFTTLSERSTAEEVVEVLTRYFSVMVEIVFAHNGTLDKFVGDAIMAVFGAPLDQADQAEAACRCALEMQEALVGLNRELEAEGHPTLAIGVGVNSGEVIAGFIGAESRMEYTVIGDTVNLASRLEGTTKEFGVGIVISESTLRKVEGLVETRELGAIKVKGKEQAVDVFALLGMKG